MLFRRRLRPTVVAAHQFIHHQGIAVNGRLAFSPRRLLQPGDTVSLRPEGAISTEMLERFFGIYSAVFITDVGVSIRFDVDCWLLLRK